MELPVSTDQMIEGVLPMVRKIADVYAQRFRCPSLTYDDLVQIGSLALVECASRWQPGRRYRDRGQAEAHFWAFAKPRVIGAMIDEVRRENKSRLVQPVKFVPLELEDEPAAVETTENESETIELVRELYNHYGEEVCEFVTDYALNEVPQAELAKKHGISQGSVSNHWQTVAERIRNILEN